MDKIAVDNSAKSYWKLLYGEYGEELVRDIPRRIKAALDPHGKTASVAGAIVPFAHAASADGLAIEGMYTDAGGRKLLFNASLDAECNVINVSSVELK